MIVSRPALLLLDLIFGSTLIRKFWIMLYSFTGGVFLAVSLQHPLTPASLLIFGTFAFGAVSFLLLENLSKIDAESAISILTEKPPQKDYEVVYVLRRSDGILKIGRTNNLSQRIGLHRGDYGMHFNALASRVVPNSVIYESMALKMTKKFMYIEGTRRELRQMTDNELSDFILAFTGKLQKNLKEVAL